jgi:hypothetical protein
MRTLSATLAAAQLTDRTPYFDLKFKRNISNTTIADYSGSGAPNDLTSRIEYMRIHELPYASGITSGTSSSESIIILNNHDCSIPEVRETYVDIGWGDVTPAGNEFATLPRMWVKHQENISSSSGLKTELILEGWAEALDEEHARLDNVLIGNVALYYLKERTDTVYQIMANILNPSYSYLPFTLDALTVDDGIINTFYPYFEINAERDVYESKLSALYRLILMTKCYLKPLANNHLKIVYPQESDATNFTIYSDTMPWFFEFHDKQNALLPNTIWVFCNDTDKTLAYDWPNLVVGEAIDTDAKTRYGGVVNKKHYQEPTILTSTDANNRAAAILARLKSETISQSLVVNHHCGIELYDHLLIKDKRGRIAYNDTKVRVTGLTHTYSRSKAIDRLSIYGGGLFNLSLVEAESSPKDTVVTTSTETTGVAGGGSKAW